MDGKKVCPKCGSDMELGELLDRDYAIQHPQNWGRSASKVPGSDFTEKKKITSYRCIQCGFLENYAP